MKKMKNIISRILISLLGVGLIYMGASAILLGFLGKSTTAVITNIRREGGERSDGKPGRYTYNISYTFTLPEGNVISGFTKKVGDSIYMRTDGTSTVQVRYLSPFPYINSMEKDTGIKGGSIALILAGGVLIFLMSRKEKIKPD